MQPKRPGAADVHGGPHPDGFKAFQRFYTFCAIFVIIHDGFILVQ
jgi:hypothetical protein